MRHRSLPRAMTRSAGCRIAMARGGLRPFGRRPRPPSPARSSARPRSRKHAGTPSSAVPPITLSGASPSNGQAITPRANRDTGRSAGIVPLLPMPNGAARASLRAGRKFEATEKITRPIGNKAIQIKWLHARTTARTAGSRLPLLREAAGRICTGMSYRSRMVRCCDKHTLMVDKIAHPSYKVKIPKRCLDLRREAWPPPPMPSGVIGYRPLSVEPEVLEAEAVVDAVDHHGHALDLRVLACRLTGVKDDRTGTVLRQPPFDLPHQLLTFFLVGFRRLLVNQLLEFGASIACVVALCLAYIVLVELLVRVVDGALADIEADSEIFAHDPRIPLRGVDGFKLAVDIDFLQLVDQDYRRIAVA